MDRQNLSGLLDLVELGPTAEMIGLELEGLDRCRHYLASRRMLDLSQSAVGGPTRMVINLDQDGADVIAQADLRFAFAANSFWRLSSRSTLWVQPMMHLRRMGNAVATERGLDGRRNFIGPTPADADVLLRSQIAFIAASVDLLVELLNEALPDYVESANERVRVRRFELCYDRTVGDAVSAAQMIASSAVPNTTQTDRDVYRAGRTLQGRVSTARWHMGKGGPVLKVYAKTHSLLRQEFACPRRSAVHKVASTAEADLHGDGVAGLLSELIEIARPELADLYQHVTNVLASVRCPHEVALALHPLLEIGLDRSRTGRRPSASAVAEARRAYDSLITTGQYTGTGLRKGTALRTTLDELARPDGPLVKDHSTSTYRLAPAHAAPAFLIAEHYAAETNEADSIEKAKQGTDIGRR